MNERLRKQFILVDQFQPRERIVASLKGQRRFQQIAVQVRAVAILRTCPQISDVAQD